MDYQYRDKIALLTLDDGKANAVGHAFLDFCNDSLDRAEADGAGAVVLAGREGMFSAGFDLGEFQKGMEEGLAMVSKGFEFLVRLYGYRLPVVIACTGHGVAMGAFLLLASDWRVGAEGDYKITLPETRINMDLPPILQALCHAQISPRFLSRAVIQSEVFSPGQAIDVGFLDEVRPPGDVVAAAMAKATELAGLPQPFYGGNKLFARSATITAMQAELDSYRQGN